MSQTDQLTLATGTGVDLALPLAGAGSRAYAYLIDWHYRVAFVIVWFAGLWLISTYMLDPQSTELKEDQTRVWALAIPTLVYILYHPVLELILRGSSPGKRAAGLRCVTLEGQTPGSGAILLRNILRLADSLPLFYLAGFMAILSSRTQQRLGDMVAGTCIIVDAPASAQTLEQLRRIEHASLPATEAEMVAELLERWSTLSKDRRRQLATTLLIRNGITADAADKRLRAQLAGLMGE